MQPQNFFLPVIYAVFLWWFSTGVIMAIYGRSRRFIRLCFVGATVLVGAAIAGLFASRMATDEPAVYMAFTCGVILWAWQIAGYYLGFVTGPARPYETTARHNRSLAQRFRLALYASLYHELAAIGFGLFIALITWSGENRWGLWIYVTLWLLHNSARLNVFLGVRNFRIELLPSQMHHLGSLLSKRSSNELFPVSILVALTIMLVAVYQAIIPGTTPAQTAGFLLLATMIALGVLEHGLLVLPVPATLWGWGIRALPEAGETSANGGAKAELIFPRGIRAGRAEGTGDDR
jgi:putative photosynthetic complex assembly protein 2